jgi:hypothetical protein
LFTAAPATSVGKEEAVAELQGFPHKLCLSTALVFSHLFISSCSLLADLDLVSLAVTIFVAPSPPLI